jgi:glycosyltransferase involved in cell wall biosynthesis
VIYHEHDTPDSSLTWDVDTARPATKASRYQRMMLWSRRQLARHARLCIIPSQERARAFVREMNNALKVACVWNCPSRSEARPHAGSAAEADLTIWYHGSVVPPKLPDTIVKALALVPAKVKLKFAGYETIGYQGYLQHLTELAAKLGIPDRVEFLGALNREELLSQCQRCDIGLAVFRDNTMMPMLGATNKPFEYLACGLALLVPDVPAWQELFVKPGYGLACACESPEGIARAIQWFVDHKAETRAMGDAGRKRILNEWNYEAQFAPIERLMTCPA